MGKSVPIVRTEHSPSQLRALAKKSEDGEQSCRLLAMAMVLEGASRADAARQGGMDRQTLRDWVHRYNALGPDGLVSRHGGGPKPKLTAAQMAEFKALAIAGPDLSVHKVVRWRCVDLRAEVARRFSVEADERTVGKWLRKCGLTRLQPRPFHPGRDAEAQEAFKKTSPMPPNKPRRPRQPANLSRYGSKTKPA